MACTAVSAIFGESFGESFGDGDGATLTATATDGESTGAADDGAEPTGAFDAAADDDAIKGEEASLLSALTPAEVLTVFLLPRAANRTTATITRPTHVITFGTANVD